MSLDFASRLEPAVVGGGFAMDDYWVWCGSVVRGEDGRYHMFASRWPRSMAFSHWVVRSEIVRASADRPEGPYAFEEVVLGAREGDDAFDAKVAHNPCIVHNGGQYLLFYTGTNFDGPIPTPADSGTWAGRRSMQAWHNKRIGLATATSVRGPWTRRATPVLDTRPDAWDAVITSNPAACVNADGAILLLYKSTDTRHDADGRFRGRFRIGAARASAFDAEFERVGDGPVLQFDDASAHVEDPFVWREGGRWCAIMKDMTGAIGGEAQAGITATSRDGVRWTLAEPVQAYSRVVRWSDGTVTRPGKLERPQLLMEDGRPTHLFLATTDATDGLRGATRTWNMVMPVEIDRG
ncbi:MAG: glycoside hydrolase family protein [Phycisphaeraceae bacterium]